MFFSTWLVFQTLTLPEISLTFVFVFPKHFGACFLQWKFLHKNFLLMQDKGLFRPFLKYYFKNLILIENFWQYESLGFNLSLCANKF